MTKETKRTLLAALLLAAFVVFTVLTLTVDVHPVGPEGSSVGFAALNTSFAEAVGYSETWETVTDLLGYLALGVVAFFAAVGAVRLLRTKSFRGVGADIYALGGFYLVVGAVYVLFEKLALNFRPVILDEGLEASYPSSHTILTVCVMLTAAITARRLWGEKKTLCAVITAAALLVMGVTVVGRLLSGVHWLTDIIGGVLISAALIVGFAAVCAILDRRNEHETNSCGEG